MAKIELNFDEQGLLLDKLEVIHKKDPKFQPYIKIDGQKIDGPRWSVIRDGWNQTLSLEFCLDNFEERYE